ncbi:tumor necrosis factor ligand superfamily member 15 [Mixophyes fleayi]|uniref:tumor necrosis factor ligand superfamily member 15 n=1 Tax=Mixophyes fleayi TaxID=3061075 RepID=UPI003F4E2511
MISSLGPELKQTPINSVKTMEVSVDMLQEENRNTNYNLSFRHAQDRSIRRLQWIVAFCVACLCVLMFLTVYQIFGGVICDRKNKVHSEPYKAPGRDHNYATEKPRAHLTGTRQHELNKDLQWESQNGLAFIRDGMEYVNKCIQIPKDGYYFVYSKVSFRPGCKKNSIVTADIRRLNHNYPVAEILLSGLSFCVGDSGFQPIYLGALLELKKGDTLKVNVTDIDQVDISVDHKTFFGAFLVQ